MNLRLSCDALSRAAGTIRPSKGRTNRGIDATENLKGIIPGISVVISMSERTNYATLTDESFQKEVIESSIPVLVEFGADWCGACHIMAPLIEDLSVEQEGRVEVARLDIDDNKQIAVRYGIRSVPTFLFFHKGRIVDRVIGAIPRAELATRCAKLLSKDQETSIHLKGDFNK